MDDDSIVPDERESTDSYKYNQPVYHRLILALRVWFGLMSHKIFSLNMPMVTPVVTLLL